MMKSSSLSLPVIKVQESASIRKRKPHVDGMALLFLGIIVSVSISSFYTAQYHQSSDITTIYTSHSIAKESWIEEAKRHSIRSRAAQQQSTSNERFVIDSTVDTLAVVQASLLDLADGDHRGTFKRKESIVQESEQKCRYEGHCPVGTTCAKPTTTTSTMDSPGSCEAYIPSESITESDPCIASCLEELTWDEQFYFDSKVNIESMWNTLSSRRPDGCIIQYHRTPQTPWDGFNIDAWKRAVQNHRVLRVDPVKDNDQRQAWKAFCYAPCSTSASCGDLFVCNQQSSQCEPEPEYWTPTNATKHDMVIVTGATSGYFHAMENLVGSCLYWAPEHSVVIYNLGLTDEQLSTAQSWPNVIHIKWKDGFPDQFPDHVKQGKIYAWKPIAMNESVHEYGNIFWLDAGNTLTGPMDPAEKIVHQTGIFLVRGQDENMEPKSHPSTYQYLGFDKTTFQGGPHYSGNTQAYLFPSRYIDTIVKPNAACAMDPACVCPDQSNLGNHRYDQTTLSVLTYQHHLMVPARTEYLAASSSQLNNDLMKPSFMFVWTARKSCDTYANWMKRLYNDKMQHGK